VIHISPLDFTEHEFAEVILAHTPLQELVPDFEDELVLVSGTPSSRTICEQYAFDNVPVHFECFLCCTFGVLGMDSRMLSQ
jgi:hypothetical protein